MVLKLGWRPDPESREARARYVHEAQRPIDHTAVLLETIYNAQGMASCFRGRSFVSTSPFPSEHREKLQRLLRRVPLALCGVLSDQLPS